MNPDDYCINRNAIIENIVTRVSVRSYDRTRPIEPATVETLLRAAMSAPTAVNRRPWAFVVVNDPQLLSRLAAALPYAKMAAQAPMAIVVCGDSTRFLAGDDATLWVQDLSAASENLLLAAMPAASEPCGHPSIPTPTDSRPWPTYSRCPSPLSHSTSSRSAILICPTPRWTNGIRPASITTAGEAPPERPHLIAAFATVAFLFSLWISKFFTLISSSIEKNVEKTA